MMTDDELNIVLAKAGTTAAGQIRLAHFEPIFTRVASACSDESGEDVTRTAAQEMMKDWAGGEGALEKGMAQHWLDRAHAVVEHGMAAGKQVAATAVAAKRKIHPMFARILAGKKQSAAGLTKLAKAFDESKHKRNKGEFASTAGTAAAVVGTGFAAGAAASYASRKLSAAPKAAVAAPSHAVAPAPAAIGRAGFIDEATGTLTSRTPINPHPAGAVMRSRAAHHVFRGVLAETGDALKAEKAHDLIHTFTYEPHILSVAQHTEASALIRKFLPHLLHAG
jgi:hypothetical protein